MKQQHLKQILPTVNRDHTYTLKYLTHLNIQYAPISYRIGTGPCSLHVFPHTENNTSLRPPLPESPSATALFCFSCFVLLFT